MITKSQSMQQPSSDEAPHKPVWTRSYVTIFISGLVALPILFGLVDEFLVDIRSTDGSSFWVTFWYVASVELTALTLVTGAVLIFPRLRDRMDVPNPSGDERERMISFRASYFAFIMAMLIMLVAGLASLTTRAIGLGQPEISFDLFINLLLAIQLSYVGSMIYLNRKV